MFVRFSFQVHGLEKTSGSGRPGQVREGKDQHSFTGSIFQYCCLEENLRNQEWRAEQSRGSSHLWSVAVVQGNLGSLSVTVLPGSYHLQGWMSVDTGRGRTSGVDRCSTTQGAPVCEQVTPPSQKYKSQRLLTSLWWVRVTPRAEQTHPVCQEVITEKLILYLCKVPLEVWGDNARWLWTLQSDCPGSAPVSTQTKSVNLNNLSQLRFYNS